MAVISLHKRCQIIGLHQNGISGRKIAQQLAVSHTAVQKIVNKHKKGWGIKNKPRPGRPRLLSRTSVRRMVICSKKEPKKTARSIQLDCGLTNLVSLDTVKRELREAGLFGRVTVKKPLLSKKNINKRKQWCFTRRDWTIQKWKQIIYTDECKLDLYPNKREYVRRPVGSRISTKYITPTTKFSKSLMLWGAIRGDGKRLLMRCEKNVDSLEYQRILGLALPVMYSSRYVFQHDGAPSHRSRSTTNYLIENQIRVLQDWPAQSPDLNVIENLWDYLKRRVQEYNPKTVDELWEIAKREWNIIPNEFISKLYESIPQRVTAVLAKQGGHTKY